MVICMAMGFEMKRRRLLREAQNSSTQPERQGFAAARQKTQPDLINITKRAGFDS
jgi:hypothetical protein